MILQDLYDCSRPLMFEHDDRPEYPYERYGSGFVFKYRGGYFLTTAKHVLRDRAPEQVRVFADESFERSLPFNLALRPTGVDPNDADYGDIVVLRIQHADLTGEELQAIGRLDLESVRPVVARPGDTLFFTGYPTEDKWIEFAEKRFGYRRVIAAARYKGASGGRHMHELTGIDTGEVLSRDGFSGCPVFRLERRGRGAVAALAGILLRASFYLDASVLFTILDSFAKTSQ
jgi:hypothetical protein